MTVLKADPALKAYLDPLTEPTEIQDGEGNLLGVFTPADRSAVVDYTEVRKLFDPEEIKRRKERSRNDPGRTTEQVLARLRSLEKSE
jgi:hypothetical protein